MDNMIDALFGQGIDASYDTSSDEHVSSVGPRLIEELGMTPDQVLDFFQVPEERRAALRAKLQAGA